MKKLTLLCILCCNILLFSQNVESKLKPALEELKDFIAIPNDALVPEDIIKNIDWLNEKFKRRGFKTQVLETEGQPLFFAESPTIKNAKTMLFYMHLDGQSVDNSKWNQENPYKAVLKVKDGND